ncbi:hypothetical protein [Kordiimonas sp.]|uniref:hypothetical protein n=1 Tax=Kordiimonas sp. TaxID=1970157 RepID=UPI003A94FBE9
MRLSSKIFSLFLPLCLATTAVQAQQYAPKEKASVLDVPDYEVPEGLFQPEDKGLADLRVFTMEQWTRIRLTNHPLYHYVLAASKFRAYVNYCKRHDLNVDLVPINSLIHMNLTEIITAQWEEPEWAKFVGKEDDTTREYIRDVAFDVYAFEFAAALADLSANRKELGTTVQQYCLTIAKPYYEEYIGLRATAMRQLPERERQLQLRK